MDSPIRTGAIPTLIQSRARPCIAYDSDSPQAATPSTHTRRAPARPTRSPYPACRADTVDAERRGMADACSITSSPSHYSHAPSRVSHWPAREHSQPGFRGGDTMQRWENNDSGREEDAESGESEYGDVASTQNRISMVSGPRVTKYADLPWEDFAQTAALPKGSSDNLGRMIRAATRTNGTYTDRSRPGSPAQSSRTLSTETTRKGLAIFGGTGKGKNLISSSSSSGVSLASTQTVSTASSDDRAHPVTPRLGAPFGSMPSPNRKEVLSGRTYNEVDLMRGGIIDGNSHELPGRKFEPSPQLHVPDRPLLSSGSPGFGLISLEAAQERERLRSHRQTTGAHIQPTPTAAPPPPQPTGRDSYVSQSPLDHQGPSSHSALAAKSIKQKKSLMKLFKADKAGSGSSTAGFSIVTPSLPSVPRMPSSAIPAVPARPRPERADSDGGPRRHPRAGGSVWSDASESAVWPTGSPQALRNNLDSGRLLKPRLELRPISMNFSNGLPSSYLSEVSSASSVSASPPRLSPLTPTEHDTCVAETIKEQIANARKGWMVQLYELEAQIRELKDALAEAKTVKPGRCTACGCACGGHATTGNNDLLRPGGGVMDRGRAKTGGARGVFGSGSLYEWE